MNLKIPSFLKKLLDKNYRNNCNISLEEAVEKGFITEEEKLRIEKDRAEEKLREFLLSKKK